MKFYQKVLIGAGIIASLAGSYKIGSNKGFEKGYNYGSHDMKEKIDECMGSELNQLERAANAYDIMKGMASANSDTNEVKRLENLSKKTKSHEVGARALAEVISRL